jgi:hypothetical protein
LKIRTNPLNWIDTYEITHFWRLNSIIFYRPLSPQLILPMVMKGDFDFEAEDDGLSFGLDNEEEEMNEEADS